MKSFPYDPEQARKLLQEAGYKDGDITFEFAMDSTTDGNTQLLYQFISQELKKVGINANIKVYDMRGALIDNFETYNGTSSSSMTYDMSRHANGIYHFVVTGKEGTLSKKVVVQH